MKVENAIKKLKRAGFHVHQQDNRVSGYNGEWRVSFFDQCGEVTCIWTDDEYSRKTRDAMTDYFPETYHRNVTQAIEFVKRQAERRDA